MSRYPLVAFDDRPAAEVWEAPDGVTVWNRYFEVVPMELVTRVVTERGVLSTSEVEEMRRGLEVPAGLRAWAAGRETR